MARVSANDSLIIQGEGIDVAEVEAPPVATFNRWSRLPVTQQRQKLTICAHREHILFAVERHRVSVLIAPTGCGKSTQVPQYLHEAGWSADGMQIVVVLPRRVAVVTVASRVAEEMNVQLGHEVGFRVRFDELCHPVETRVMFATDGTFLRMLQKDPLIENVAVVMIDDAHERSASSDLLCGLLRKVMKKRKHLRLIISSASLDATMYENYFRRHWMTEDHDALPLDELRLVPSRFDRTGKESPRHGRHSGFDREATEKKKSDELKDVTRVAIDVDRTFPIEMQYLDTPAADYVKSAVGTVRDIHHLENPGDILVFMTGQDEIDTACEMIREALPEPPASGHAPPRSNRKELYALPLPLYTNLTFERQLRVFKPAPPDTRKIIFSTNVAESSVTIPGIGFVVDCGFTKLKATHPDCAVEQLYITPASQSALKQRAGRAGRDRPGKCFRLFPEECMDYLPKQNIPEILRSNLAESLLFLKSFGIEDLLNFEFLTPPSVRSFERALETLHALGALDESGRLTDPFGIQMAELPLPPHIARFLLISASKNEANDADDKQENEEEELGPQPDFISTRPPAEEESIGRCLSEALTISAMLSVASPWTATLKLTKRDAAKKGLAATEGDLLTLYNVYRHFEFYEFEDPEWSYRHFVSDKVVRRAQRVRRQLETKMRSFGFDPKISCGEDALRLTKTVCASMFINAAQKQRDGTYSLCRWAQLESSRRAALSPPLIISPESVLFASQPEWVVFDSAISGATISEEMKLNFGGDKLANDVAQMRNVTAITPAWLSEVAPHFYTRSLRQH